MSFDRPTLATLIGRATADAESRLTGGAPLLPISNLAILARVHAGAVHGLYGYLAWIADQLLPDTAEAELLARHAAIWGISRLAATYSAGDVTFHGTLGAVVPEGTRVRRADGTEYRTDALCTIGEDPFVVTAATVSVTAVTPGAGADSAEDTPLSLTSALSGVQTQAAVAAGGLTGGADGETDEALRARLLGRIRQPPQGGAASDYVAWALAAHPDVTRAWCYPRELGMGTVVVRIMTDVATVDGIPENAVVEAVADYIDPLRPVTAAVTVVAPVPDPLDIILWISPDTDATRTAVEAALADLILREAEPGGVLRISHIREAISGAAGEVDHGLVSPISDVEAETGAIITLGGITWA